MKTIMQNVYNLSFLARVERCRQRMGVKMCQATPSGQRQHVTVTDKYDKIY